jgi:hypothetical protein
MLIPLEAEVESLHASAAAFLRPQSSSLRDHQHPAGRDRARHKRWLNCQAGSKARLGGRHHLAHGPAWRDGEKDK